MIFKSAITQLAILFVFAISSSYASINPDSELVLIVKNIEKAVGDVYVAIYDNEGDYMKNRMAEARAAVISRDDLEIKIKLPKGKYAISIFHDTNEDGELSTNFLGIPKEPYGFSNNHKAKFGPPSFEQSLFEFVEDGQVIEIELR